MNPERAIKVLRAWPRAWPWVGDFEHVHPDEQHEATDMGAAALAEVAALRAELEEAKAMLGGLEHEERIDSYNEDNSINWKCVSGCPACARDKRWPVKKEGS